MKKYTILALLLLLTPSLSLAAGPALFLSTNSGAYSQAKDLQVRLLVNSGGGQGINAAESVLKFNPKEITIKKVDLTGSIFDLWAIKPKVDAAKGTIKFSGGSTKAFKGSNGTLLKLTITPKKAINSNVSISTTTSQLLSADGWATNILSVAAGGKYQFVSKANIAKYESFRDKSLGKVLVDDKTKNKASYINITDRLRYDFSTSTELEPIIKKLAQKVDHKYIIKYASSTLPSSMAGRFLTDAAGKSTNYYYVGPVSKKMYFLSDFVTAYKLFLSIGATTPADAINRIPDGLI